MPITQEEHDRIIDKALGLPGAEALAVIIRLSTAEAAEAWERGNVIRHLGDAIPTTMSRLVQTQDAEARTGIEQNIAAMLKQLQDAIAGVPLSDIQTVPEVTDRLPEYYKRLSDGSQLWYEKLPDGSKRYYTKDKDGNRVYKDSEGN